VFSESFYGKLGLHISDGSYVDAWFSRRIPGRYAYHWERRHIDGSIYRHDNRPNARLEDMKTFPKTSMMEATKTWRKAISVMIGWTQ
jgi:hypothetical protein